MRTARMLGGLALALLPAVAVGAETATYTITMPEVLVRSGPSPEFYPTSKLQQGNTVRAVRDEVTGWLAIVPPPDSFSWIDTRQVDQFGTSAQVSAAEAPIRVGSRLVNLAPTVEGVRVKRGTQLTVIGKALVSRDGTWLPILPAPAEVRYIPADAVRPITAAQQFASVPSAAVHSSSSQTDSVLRQPSSPAFAAGSPSSSQNDSASPPAPANSTNPLWLQAEQAERAGNIAQAQSLLEELAQQVKATDHELWLRCLNRLQALRERRPDTLAARQQPACFMETSDSRNNRANDRLVPTPANSYAGVGISSPPPQAGRASSEYCYVRDPGYTARLSAPVLSAPKAPPHGPGQWYEPGRLCRTTFFVDGKPAYRLEPLNGNRMWMYVTAGGNVNLEPYVEKNVSLYGPVVYRGDLRTNYMTVVQVSPVR